jgi:hypothetical protein
VDAPAEDVEVRQLEDALQVADAAVDDEAGLGPGLDRCRQVVTDEGAVLDLAEEVDDQHVALLQRVDDPGVLAAAPSLGGAHALDDLLEIRPQGTIRTVTALPTRTRSGWRLTHPPSNWNW